MVQKMVAVVLVVGSLTIAACNTVRGRCGGRELGRQLHRDRNARR